MTNVIGDVCCQMHKFENKFANVSHDYSQITQIPHTETPSAEPLYTAESYVVLRIGTREK